MAKIRVGQLAKELNLKVPDVVARLREIGIESKTNLSTVDDEAADRLRASAPRAAGGAAAHAPSTSKGAKSSKAAKAPRSEPERPREAPVVGASAPVKAAGAAPSLVKPKIASPVGSGSGSAPVAPGSTPGAA